MQKLTSQGINGSIELLLKHASTLLGFGALLRYCIERNAEGFVVVKSREIIGVIAGRFEEDTNSVSIDLLCVHSHFRNLGISRQLIDRLVAQFGDDKRYHLEVRVSNVLAQSMYDRYGFFTSGRKALYYPNEDALTMELAGFPALTI